MQSGGEAERKKQASKLKKRIIFGLSSTSSSNIVVLTDFVFVPGQHLPGTKNNGILFMNHCRFVFTHTQNNCDL